jgi:hypothetical protein
MTEIRKWLDSKGIKPWGVTRASAARLYRLQELCIYYQMFGENKKKYLEEVNKSLQERRAVLLSSNECLEEKA